jgi:hypothetical protein
VANDTAKTGFDIVVALFAILGGLYAAVTWFKDYVADWQRIHVELRLDASTCTPNDGNAKDAVGGAARVTSGFARVCVVQVDIHNVGSIDFTSHGDAIFYVCQSNPLRIGERTPPYVQIAGPVRIEPQSGSPAVTTYSNNIVQLVGQLKQGTHVNLRFTAYTRAGDNAGIALKPYLPGVTLAPDTPAPADLALCRNGETD